MESIVEFALYTWVVVSILAVLVQLVRMLRYRRANAARTQAATTEPVRGDASPESARPTLEARPTEPATIDLEQPATATAPSSAVPESVAASKATSTAAPGTSASSPTAPLRPTAGAPAAPSTPRAAWAKPTATPAPAEPPAPPTATPAPAEPSTPPTAAPSPADALTLADLLSGVRLPWNLLPTVDQSRPPSNDRVALITADGAPADVGADVADELERLGFAITTRGEDIAIATRGTHVLGLQILPDAATIMTGDQLRFPGAAANAVALDIWIES